MWLLHTATLRLREFLNNIPDYAILSHTWAIEEVTFEDVGQIYAQELAGFAKVQNCCNRARQDGFDWVWIDTCCIQKTSSAELSEAINSMWKYYWRASVCYAQLSDVIADDNPDQGQLRTSFNKSRWFTRGWTLQELVAPAVVEFYDANWLMLGTKSSLGKLVSEAAGINRLVLTERSRVQHASVAQKLQWAARRETSREEDMAYCLLGLLNINMPLLYGEGKRAFTRLQMELMQASNEHTLFAWNQPRPDSASYGFLATSPTAFQNSGNVRAANIDMPGFVMTNRGLLIQLPCIPHPTTTGQLIVLLNCYFEQYSMDSSLRASDADATNSLQPGRCGIVLETDGSGRYIRVHSHPMLSISYVDADAAQWRELCIVANTGLDQENHHHRTPYGIHLQPLASLTRKFKILRILKSCPCFIEGRYVGIEGPFSLYTQSVFFRLDPDDFVGILLGPTDSTSAETQTFFIAFGQRGYSMLWLEVRRNIDALEFAKALKMARVQAAIDADLHRDAVDLMLGVQDVISVRAKKIRMNDLVGWQLLIILEEVGAITARESVMEDITMEDI